MVRSITIISSPLKVGQIVHFPGFGEALISRIEEGGIIWITTINLFNNNNTFRFQISRQTVDRLIRTTDED